MTAPHPAPAALPVADAALAADWLGRGRPAVVVVVGETRGSVPRERGTRMLVALDEVAGTIGGGHLEWQAIAQARERLTAGAPPAWDWPVALGPSLGQCCGGALTLHFRPLDAAALADWPRDTPRFHLQLYGAGHVGRAIITLLAQIPCRVQWIDERESEFPPAPLPPHIQRVCVEPVEAEVALAPPGSAYLVLTHSHDLDLALTQAILRRDDVGWFGLIGSATKRARFEHRLAERGIPAERIAAMHCPIGWPGISGKEPGVIAVAVVAQLLAAWPHAPG
ncbi:xanthine dehydrogenase accessory protein XdhC [Ideonella sp. 4Y16]|uniref:xanthine dehydrogenase accessory protein XdhC n=1 Tax=Ideonella alba TaxID=2824118 RepID=UPI001B382CE6|nr:xanthine dehydrogenase accessory protein XdhC [Ideonella alba]MBQ0941809.1 xanthine dehydrogenase accessory protein XdhC [Ideonella alba]